MCGIHFYNETDQKAHKDHHCAACGYKIPKGFIYTRSFCVMDGGVISDKWHIECKKSFDKMLDGNDCGYPEDTWPDDLPEDLMRKYGIESMVVDNG